jgi:uncharacterized PurR-regulated membrane protein YhhQ (DUF165 family)
MLGWSLWAAFIACVPLSNWLIANIGTTCVPSGPCLIPVWPGVLAPSGVLLAGLSFVLRDFVQEGLGLVWAIAAVLIGGGISGLSASPLLATASVTAFLLAEGTDLLVYTTLRRRGVVVASFASSVIGLLLDSIVFVWIAFGTPEYILGQSIGKSWMVLLTLPLLVALRHLRSGAPPVRAMAALTRKS